MVRSGWTCVALICVLSVAVVRADVETANRYLTEAADLVHKGSNYKDDAASKLDLAEASLDDVPADQKAPLKAKLDALRGQLAAAAGAEDKAKIERQIKELLVNLENMIGNSVVWPEKSNELTTLLNDPKTTTALGADQVAAYQKQFATFAKVHATKALKENLTNATKAVDELETYWKQAKTDIAAQSTPEGRRQRIGSAENEFDAIDRPFKDLPPENADVKALQARVTALKSDFSTLAGDSQAQGVVEEMNRYFDTYSNEFGGMDQEKGNPTWADFKASKEDARNFNLRKTMDYYGRVSKWLPELQERDNYKAAKDAPAVKTKVAEIEKKVADSHEKLLAAAEKLTTEFEKEKVTTNNVGDGMGLTSQIKYALGENDPAAKAMVARIDKQFADAKNASDKADNDKDAYYKSMTEQADKAWPGMAAKFDVSEGFDPNNASAMSGKYIKIVSNNLMGWRFKHGDFPYATTLNGVPVAGRYDPTVKAALDEVEKKLGRAIGDSDDDGQWTAIAKVEGNKGKLVQLVKSSGDVSVNGSNVGTVEATDERPVDAPIVTIVALKAGPVAVAQGQGAVHADGSVAAPVGISSHRGFSLLGVISGLLAILVGATCLMKAQFAPLAANANAIDLTNRMGAQNIAYLGLASIVLGAIGLLMNLIALPSAFFHAVIGLVASAAMIVAGGVSSSEFLRQRNWLPDNVGSIFSRFAVPAGLTCAALGVLTLLLSLF